MAPEGHAKLLITLTTRWRIRSDEHQWIVQRRLGGEKGGRRDWKPQGYFRTLSGATIYTAEAMIRADESRPDLSTLTDVYASINCMREAIVAAVKEGLAERDTARHSGVEQASGETAAQAA